MRIARDRLAFHALCVLAQARDAAQHGRVAPSPSLRLAMAVIAHLGGSEHLIDLLWEELTRRSEVGDEPGALGRSQMLNAGFKGAAQVMGIEVDDKLNQAIANAIRTADSREAPAPG